MSSELDFKAAIHCLSTSLLLASSCCKHDIWALFRETTVTPVTYRHLLLEVKHTPMLTKLVLGFFNQILDLVYNSQQFCATSGNDMDAV